MATAYIRNLAQSGIVPDIDAYDLSLTTLSMGVNARCQDGHVERGPVCRRAGTLPAPPAFGVSYDQADGSTTSMVVADDGRVHEWSPQTAIDRTPTGWTPAVSTAPTTATILNDVVFLNRSDRTPWYRAKSASGAFGRLEMYNSNNGGAQFSSNLRFNALRATANILVGINVTKDGQTFGNMVKWSNYGDQGLPPRDWDVTGIIYQNGQEVALSAAGENTLAEMTGYLVDGCKLGNNLVLYGSREAWLMEFVGGTAIFTFRRLFDAGVMSVNCVVEKEGAHFVFGDNDIYAHDGTGTRTSIAQGKVRQFIYRNIVKTEASRSFVAHNRDLNEIVFCYVSTDQYCAFPYQAGVTTIGCNRAAVYNYASSAWYFYDLPWASISLLGAVTPSLTYADAATLTYDQIGSSYAAQSDPKASFLLASPSFTTSTGSQPAAVRSFTLPDASSSSLAIDLPANAPMILEKSQIDLDGLKNIAGYPITLNGTKRIGSIDVVGTVSPDSTGVYFTVGASNHPSETPIWGTTQTFDINFARIDCNQTGKFLALRAKYSDYYPLRISGFDLDLSVSALR